MGYYTIADDRPNMNEIYYTADRLMKTYRHDELNELSDLPNYSFINIVCGESDFLFSIFEKIRTVHKKFKYCEDLYKLSINSNVCDILVDPRNGNGLSGEPSIHYEYKNEIECIIFLMKRVLDTLVQVTSLMVNLDYYKRNKKFKFDGIGPLFRKDLSTYQEKQIIFGYETKYNNNNNDFLFVINQLFNSFKHCLIHDESLRLQGNDFPTILSLYVDRNDYNQKPYYHNHNAYHIMMGFQDTIKNIIANQKTYQDEFSSKDV